MGFIDGLDNNWSFCIDYSEKKARDNMREIEI